MKKLQDILHESILDDEDKLNMDSDLAALKSSIVTELTETYGEICLIKPIGFLTSDVIKLTTDNIAIDKKGRIQFVNIPKNMRVEIDLGSIGTPDCFRQRGVICLDCPIVIKNYGSYGSSYDKISKLNIQEAKNIVLSNCRIELDKFPKHIEEVYFKDCGVNIFKKPMSLPKGCTIYNDTASCDKIIDDVLKKFYGDYPETDYKGLRKNKI